MKIVCIKMRYSIEPKDRIYVKGYGFLSFAKNIGKSLSNKYGQKLLDSAKKSTTDAIKTASKRAIQKTAEATGDLIGNKIADKITNVSKKNNDPNNETEEDVEITTHKKRSISPEERQQIINELRLIPKNDAYLMHQINHLNLEQEIGLKQMMKQRVHTLLINKLNLKH